jgi:myo-inositol-1-phosphate synthase
MSIRVAIIGVGNCANSFVQGLEYYKDEEYGAVVPGLMHTVLGGYRISDIEVVAAFDVVKGKVGLPLNSAIWAEPNDTIRFTDRHTWNYDEGPVVQRGMLHDGIGKYLAEVVEIDRSEAVDVAQILKDRQVDVVINYLPVGSEEAVRWYVEQILTARCAMVNAMPVFIAREHYWGERFKKAGVPVIGDDIKSQLGATILHRVLAQLFDERGIHLERTMQLNVGGNSDFLNMKEPARLVSKKESKTNAVTSIAGVEFAEGDIHVGPSDHVPWLTDRKWAYIRLEGSGFGDVPLEMECKLSVWDSPNSAGVIIDAVRLAKLGLDRKLSGAMVDASAYLFKSPPVQIRDNEARENLERFIADV